MQKSAFHFHRILFFWGGEQVEKGSVLDGHGYSDGHVSDEVFEVDREARRYAGAERDDDERWQSKNR